MERRRSPRLHPQIQATQEGAEVTRRRSPRLHPQIHVSEEGAGMTHRIRRRRCGTSPPAAASLPDDDDMLREILIRLPPRPSSLPRASAVCKRWHGLVTDRKFHRQFYAHHRKPPLLGIFTRTVDQDIVFNPILDPPDRVPLERFDHYMLDCYMLDCRHGLILVKDLVRYEVLVCAPITGEQRWVSVPPEFKIGYFNGAVLCAADDRGHVHGDCHSSPFKVVLLNNEHRGPTVCVYSSETGIWGNIISTEAPHNVVGDIFRSPSFNGNALYWLSSRDPKEILEFDLDGQRLGVIIGPVVSSDFHPESRRHIVQAEDGALGLAILSYPNLQMWQRNVNGHGVATWVPWKTIEMHNILGLSLDKWLRIRWQLGYDEDNDVIFVNASSNVYAVQLKSMHSKKLHGINGINGVNKIYPFTSFLSPGTAIIGGSNGAEMLDGA